MKTGEKVAHFCNFYDDKWSKNRAVTSINWSLKHPELCLASYHSKPDHIVGKDPEGVVMLWSLLLPQRPEYIFHCQVRSDLSHYFCVNDKTTTTQQKLK